MAPRSVPPGSAWPHAGRTEPACCGRADRRHRQPARARWRACWPSWAPWSIDADALAREVVAPGTPGLARGGWRAFGPEVLAAGRLAGPGRARGAGVRRPGARWRRWRRSCTRWCGPARAELAAAAAAGARRGATTCRCWSRTSSGRLRRGRGGRRRRRGAAGAAGPAARHDRGGRPARMAAQATGSSPARGRRRGDRQRGRPGGAATRRCRPLWAALTRRAHRGAA